LNRPSPIFPASGHTKAQNINGAPRTSQNINNEEVEKNKIMDIPNYTHTHSTLHKPNDHHQREASPNLMPMFNQKEVIQPPAALR
jgi:hypothetical protein